MAPSCQLKCIISNDFLYQSILILPRSHCEIKQYDVKQLPTAPVHSISLNSLPNETSFQKRQWNIDDFEILDMNPKQGTFSNVFFVKDKIDKDNIYIMKKVSVIEDKI